MGTRSDIIVKHPDTGEYASIYCHWDGYPSHNGRILLEYYQTYDEVVALISEGQLSTLAETPEACNSYHKWRGEDKNILISKNVDDHINQSYSYLFKDGQWYVTSGSRWKKLTEKICKEE